MSNVIRFPTRLRAIPLITVEQIAVRDALAENDQPACPHCAGRGVTIRMINPRAWFPADYVSEPCPCGGTDEDRIDLNDFGGAA
jgi:hypothetical protein